jgi:pilus assembly protein CpaF
VTATRLDDVKSALHRRLLADPMSVPASDPVALRARLAELLDEEAPLVAPADAEVVLEAIAREVNGLGPLEPLLRDPDVAEIMLNGPGRAFVERRGRLVSVDLALDADAIEQLAQRVVGPLGLRLDRASPMADARLRDGSRLHAVLPPLAPDGPIVTIRRFAAHRIDIEDFGVDAPARAWLEWSMRAGWNLLIAGATSAGKTTLLNALASAVDLEARIVTIEETAELRLPQPHVVRLEGRPANTEGVGAVGVRELVRAALRMRPDRIVVGEVRGGEALDMLQALNTGHDGSLCTVHANSPRDALTRLETLALFAASGLPLVAIRRQIAAAIDAVVFVARGVDGRRRIEAIAEVGAVERDDEPLVAHPLFERRGGTLVEQATATRCPRSRAEST